MDIIFLSDFKAKTLIGIYPWERKVAQTIQLDLEIALPDKRAAETDSIEHAVDYARVVECIREILEKKHFMLLEALAEHIAHTIMKEFKSPWVRISVAKLGIIRGVKRIGVCIERGTRYNAEHHDGNR
ncbi:MAG: dihydroneopterin aldolase [Burkholderiales bacterium]|nr:dihydroneopterin aldolase [Nitrosomonas sp.]MCP5276360.1 dihydroneopterin aldolase [Burkholderiales bacterium]